MNSSIEIRRGHVFRAHNKWTHDKNGANNNNFLLLLKRRKGLLESDAKGLWVSAPKCASLHTPYIWIKGEVTAEEILPVGRTQSISCASIRLEAQTPSFSFRALLAWESPGIPLSSSQEREMKHQSTVAELAGSHAPESKIWNAIYPSEASSLYYKEQNKCSFSDVSSSRQRTLNVTLKIKQKDCNLKLVVPLVAHFTLVNMSAFPNRLGLSVGSPEDPEIGDRVQVVALGDDLWKHPERSGERGPMASVHPTVPGAPSPYDASSCDCHLCRNTDLPPLGVLQTHSNNGAQVVESLMWLPDPPSEGKKDYSPSLSVAESLVSDHSAFKVQGGGELFQSGWSTKVSLRKQQLRKDLKEMSSRSKRMKCVCSSAIMFVSLRNGRQQRSEAGDNRTVLSPFRHSFYKLLTRTDGFRYLSPGFALSDRVENRTQIPMSANGLLLIKMTLFPTMENKDESIRFTVNTDNKTGLLKHYHISVPLCHKHWATVSSNKAKASGRRPKNLICVDIAPGPQSEIHPHTHQAHGTKMKLPCKNPAYLAQQQEPWSRLSSTPMITSMRRDVYFFDPEIPKDDLDFCLAALYNHHTGTFKNKSEILLHQETTQDTHGIIKTQFPGELLPPPLPPSITSLANIRHWINPKKESIHSIQGSIVSPHTAATNGGYSRKNDGGFFST
ncbi:PREDICTED: uncharacterized protein LOC101368996 [Odobenus rosmarus divergens]|uniref:Uncharacterized protein LOC101368996 n=1 Tax=Odobenus rosmarus divergens TaxID=9708 RepID=A0A9B0HDK5_ODORO